MGPKNIFENTCLDVALFWLYNVTLRVNVSVAQLVENDISNNMHTKNDIFLICMFCNISSERATTFN